MGRLPRWCPPHRGHFAVERHPPPIPPHEPRPSHSENSPFSNYRTLPPRDCAPSQRPPPSGLSDFGNRRIAPPGIRKPDTPRTTVIDRPERLRNNVTSLRPFALSLV